MFYITYTAEENSFLLALFTYKVFAMESINAKKKKKKKKKELNWRQLVSRSLYGQFFVF